MTSRFSRWSIHAQRHSCRRATRRRSLSPRFASKSASGTSGHLMADGSNRLRVRLSMSLPK